MKQENNKRKNPAVSTEHSPLAKKAARPGPMISPHLVSDTRSSDYKSVTDAKTLGNQVVSLSPYSLPQA